MADVTNAFMQTDGYVDFMRACSYGKMVFDPSALTVRMRVREDACGSRSISGSAPIRLGTNAIDPCLLLGLVCLWVPMGTHCEGDSWLGLRAGIVPRMFTVGLRGLAHYMPARACERNFVNAIWRVTIALEPTLVPQILNTPVPCSAAIKSCDEDAIAAAAKAFAVKQLGQGKVVRIAVAEHGFASASMSMHVYLSDCLLPFLALMHSSA